MAQVLDKSQMIHSDHKTILFLKLYNGPLLYGRLCPNSYQQKAHTGEHCYTHAEDVMTLYFYRGLCHHHSSTCAVNPGKSLKE